MFCCSYQNLAVLMRSEEIIFMFRKQSRMIMIMMMIAMIFVLPFLPADHAQGLV